MSDSSPIVPADLVQVPSNQEIPPEEIAKLNPIDFVSRDPNERVQDADLALSVLSRVQQKVIYLLIEGCTTTDIACQMNLDRSTIYRWRRFDKLFRYALDLKHRQLREEAADNLKVLIHQSAHVVQTAVHGHDLRAALFVLKNTGLLKAIEKQQEEKPQSPI